MQTQITSKKSSGVTHNYSLRRFLSTIGMLTVPWMCGAANGATLSVCKSGCAYAVVQSAINAAHSGDTITVGPGTYFENLSVKGKTLTIIGSGEDFTVLDGGFHGVVVNVIAGEVAGAIVKPSLTLIAVTVTHGSEGGIVVLRGAFNLQNSIVTSNRADGLGGGIAITSAAAKISKSIISHNAATDHGGGIWIESEATLSIDSSTVTRNAAARGGGLYVGYKTEVTATNTVFADNTATTDGGGIFKSAGDIHVPGGKLSVSSSSFVNNHALNDGGGIYAEGGLALSSLVLARNTAAGSGGGIRLAPGVNNNLGSVILNDAFVVQNSAGVSGGGISAVGSVVNTGSTIAGNTPDECVATQGGC